MPPDLAQLIKVRSQLSTALLDYLRSVIDAPDESRLLPACIGGRKISTLYVSPDVLKRERFSDSGGHPPEQAGERRKSVENRLSWAGEWPEIGSGSHRCAVLLAPPGQGKSTLVRMTAREIADASFAALTSYAVGVEYVRLPIAVALDSLIAPKLPGATPEDVLRRALEAALLDSGVPALAAQYLSACADTNRCWLFIDALDEVRDERSLSTVFAVLKHWQCRIVLTSRPYGYDRRLLPLDLSEYRLAPLSVEQSRTLVFKWFGGGAGRRHLNALLADSHSVRQLGRNPFLLTLLCWVVERRRLSPEMTRTQLLDLAIQDLLGQAIDGQGEVNRQRAEELLPLLQEVAITFLCQGAGREPMPVGRLLRLIERYRWLPVPLGLTPSSMARVNKWQQASFLLDELREKGLLIPLTRDRDSFVFPHRTILKYLSAGALADSINEATSGAAAAWELIKDRVSDPDWQEVIIFLTGRLNDPTALLEVLADPAGDDVFRHRLSLAALSLPELGADLPSSQKRLVNRITEAAFKFWAWHRGRGTERVVSHLIGALPGLARLNGEVEGQPLRRLLSSWMRSTAVEDRRRAAEAIGLCRLADKDEALLLIRLAKRDDDPAVRAIAAASLGRLEGEAIAESGAFSVLVELALREPYSLVRRSAAATIGDLSRETPLLSSVAAILVDALMDAHPQTRANAAVVLGQLGPAVATHPRLLPSLIESALHDPDISVRWQAQAVIKKMGREGRTEQPGSAEIFIGEGLSVLLKALRNGGAEVRLRAATTIAQLGRKAASQPEVLAILGKILDSDDLNPRLAAASALVLLNEDAPFRREAAAFLTEALHYPDSSIRLSAATAIGHAGPNIVSDREMICSLKEIAVGDPDPLVRLSATTAIGRAGPLAVAGAQVMATLINIAADDPDPSVRMSAAAAIGCAGTLIGSDPQAMATLIALATRDSDTGVRRSAAAAIGQAGRAAVEDPRVLQTLISLALQDPDTSVQWSAAAAIGELGRDAAEQVGIYQLLLDSLNAPDEETRSVAAYALDLLQPMIEQTE